MILEYKANTRIGITLVSLSLRSISYHAFQLGNR